VTTIFRPKSFILLPFQIQQAQEPL
jgi:hypothetical protein